MYRVRVAATFYVALLCATLLFLAAPLVARAQAPAPSSGDSAANKQCPATGLTNVYRQDLKHDTTVQIAGKYYYNLYGKACQEKKNAGRVIGYCQAEDKCHATCYYDAGGTTCKPVSDIEKKVDQQVKPDTTQKSGEDITKQVQDANQQDQINCAYDRKCSGTLKPPEDLSQGPYSPTNNPTSPLTTGERFNKFLSTVTGNDFSSGLGNVNAFDNTGILGSEWQNTFSPQGTYDYSPQNFGNLSDYGVQSTPDGQGGYTYDTGPQSTGFGYTQPQFGDLSQYGVQSTPNASGGFDYNTGAGDVFTGRAEPVPFTSDPWSASVAPIAPAAPGEPIPQVPLAGFGLDSGVSGAFGASQPPLPSAFTEPPKTFNTITDANWTGSNQPVAFSEYINTGGKSIAEAGFGTGGDLQQIANPSDIKTPRDLATVRSASPITFQAGRELTGSESLPISLHGGWVGQTVDGAPSNFGRLSYGDLSWVNGNRTDIAGEYSYALEPGIVTGFWPTTAQLANSPQGPIDRGAGPGASGPNVEVLNPGASPSDQTTGLARGDALDLSGKQKPGPAEQTFDVTAYFPCKSASACPVQGGLDSAKPGLDGISKVRTLDDYRLGKSDFVTGAANLKKYEGQTYEIPSITYKSPIDGKTYTLENVPVYVHDTGGAFVGSANKLDIATGVANSESQARQLASGQPFLGDRYQTYSQVDLSARAIEPTPLQYARTGGAEINASGGDSRLTPSGDISAGGRNAVPDILSGGPTADSVRDINFAGLSSLRAIETGAPLPDITPNYDALIPKPEWNPLSGEQVTADIQNTVNQEGQAAQLADRLAQAERDTNAYINANVPVPDTTQRSGQDITAQIARANLADQLKAGQGAGPADYNSFYDSVGIPKMTDAEIASKIPVPDTSYQPQLPTQQEAWAQLLKNNGQATGASSYNDFYDAAGVPKMTDAEIAAKIPTPDLTQQSGEDITKQIQDVNANDAVKNLAAEPPAGQDTVRPDVAGTNTGNDAVLAAIDKERTAAQAAVDAARARLRGAQANAQIAELSGQEPCVDTGFIECPLTTATRKLDVAQKNLDTVNANYDACASGSCPASIVAAQQQAEKGQGATSAWFKAAENSFASDLSKHVDNLKNGSLLSPVDLAYVASDGVGYTLTWGPRKLLEGTSIGDALGFRATPDEVITDAANPGRALEDKITAGRDVSMLTVPVAADMAVSSRALGTLSSWTAGADSAGARAAGDAAAPLANSGLRSPGVVDAPPVPTTGAVTDATRAAENSVMEGRATLSDSANTSLARPNIVPSDAPLSPTQLPPGKFVDAKTPDNLSYQQFIPDKVPDEIAVSPKLPEAPAVTEPAPRPVEPISPKPVSSEPVAIKPNEPVPSEPVTPKPIETAPSPAPEPVPQTSVPQVPRTLEPSVPQGSVPTVRQTVEYQAPWTERFTNAVADQWDSFKGSVGNVFDRFNPFSSAPEAPTAAPRIPTVEASPATTRVVEPPRYPQYAPSQQPSVAGQATGRLVEPSSPSTINGPGGSIRTGQDGNLFAEAPKTNAPAALSTTQEKELQALLSKLAQQNKTAAQNPLGDLGTVRPGAQTEPVPGLGGDLGAVRPGLDRNPALGTNTNAPVLDKPHVTAQSESPHVTNGLSTFDENAPSIVGKDFNIPTTVDINGVSEVDRALYANAANAAPKAEQTIDVAGSARVRIEPSLETPPTDSRVIALNDRYNNVSIDTTNKDAVTALGAARDSSGHVTYVRVAADDVARLQAGANGEASVSVKVYPLERAPLGREVAVGEATPLETAAARPAAPAEAARPASPWARSDDPVEATVPNTARAGAARAESGSAAVGVAKSAARTIGSAAWSTTKFCLGGITKFGICAVGAYGINYALGSGSQNAPAAQNTTAGSTAAPAVSRPDVIYPPADIFAGDVSKNVRTLDEIKNAPRPAAKPDVIYPPADIFGGDASKNIKTPAVTDSKAPAPRSPAPQTPAPSEPISGGQSGFSRGLTSFLSGAMTSIGQMLARTFGGAGTPAPNASAPAPAAQPTAQNAVTTAAAPVVTITANPVSVSSGKTTTLFWTALGPTNCSVFNPDGSTLVAGGGSGTSTTPAIIEESIFKITCTGGSGPANGQVTVKLK